LPGFFEVIRDKTVALVIMPTAADSLRKVICKAIPAPSPSLDYAHGRFRASGIAQLNRHGRA